MKNFLILLSFVCCAAHAELKYNVPYLLVERVCSDGSRPIDEIMFNTSAVGKTYVTFRETEFDFAPVGSPEKMTIPYQMEGEIIVIRNERLNIEIRDRVTFTEDTILWISPLDDKMRGDVCPNADHLRTVFKIQ